jgi:hypothetical protein
MSPQLPPKIDDFKTRVKRLLSSSFLDQTLQTLVSFSFAFIFSLFAFCKLRSYAKNCVFKIKNNFLVIFVEGHYSDEKKGLV